MRSLCFFLFLGLAPLSLLGQAERDSVDIYCVITSQGRFIMTKSKMSVAVDYGKKKPDENSDNNKGSGKPKKSVEDANKGLPQDGVPDQSLADQEAERETFETMAEAMNYLSARGWEYVETYGLAQSETTIIFNHCIMRKRVPVGEVGEK